MRWDYGQPNGQVFVSNGKKLLIYQPPEEGEKHGQLIERALELNGGEPVDLVIEHIGGEQFGQCVGAAMVLFLNLLKPVWARATGKARADANAGGQHLRHP